MAFENSDQMKDCLGGCLEKYKKDKDIFKKTLTMIDFYMRRSDWPNCIDELDEKARKVIGESIIYLTWGIGKYINNPSMKWDDISESFKDEYIYFYNCIGEVYNRYWHGRFYPNGLNNVSYSKGDKDIYYLKFAKNNDEKIEIEMKKLEIEYLIDNLKSIMEESENE